MIKIGGTNNTANGVAALSTNTRGGGNVAIGTAALFKNDIGNTNTAVGDSALANNIGLASDNTAIGADAVFSLRRQRQRLRWRRNDGVRWRDESYLYP